MSRTNVATIDLEQSGDTYAATVHTESGSVFCGVTRTIGTSLALAVNALLDERDRKRAEAARDAEAASFVIRPVST